MRRLNIIGIRCQLLQLTQRLIAMLRNPRHHVVNHRSRFLVLDFAGRHSQDVRVKRKRKMNRLLNFRRVCNRLFGLIERDA